MTAHYDYDLDLELVRGFYPDTYMFQEMFGDDGLTESGLTEAEFLKSSEYEAILDDFIVSGAIDRWFAPSPY